LLICLATPRQPSGIIATVDAEVLVGALFYCIISIQRHGMVFRAVFFFSIKNKKRGGFWGRYLPLLGIAKKGEPCRWDEGDRWKGKPARHQSPSRICCRGPYVCLFICHNLAATSHPLEPFVGDIYLDFESSRTDGSERDALCR
jgi:hypothetical protein